MRTMSALILAALAAAATVSPLAQSAAPAGNRTAFEVASIRRSPPGAALPGPMTIPPGQSAVRPGGRFLAAANTVRDLVRVAYGIQDVQIAGGPPWAGSDLFDIEATTRPDVTAEDARAMLRDLLADRFKLAARHETREMTVTALEPARTDRRLGPQLRQSGPECAPPLSPPTLRVPPPPPPPPGTGGSLILSNQTRTRCLTLATPWHLSLRETTLPQFTIRLTGLLGRLVVDRTGLAGLYDLDLTFSPEPGTPPPIVNGAPLVIDAPALATALRDQLGLKLETTRAPVEVIVIDSVEPPTEN